MPPAIIPAVIAGVVGIGSMINQNVQNKNAIKNNETQQASAVSNAQSATKTGQASEAAYNAANPNPTAGATVTPPPAANYAGPSTAGKTLSPASAVTANPLVKSILQAAQTGGSAPSAGSAPLLSGAPSGVGGGANTNALVQKILSAAA